MTFSIIARDTSGAIGQAISSSSPAVAARCLNVSGNVGAVSSQNITDPRFGPLLIHHLSKGKSAKQSFEYLEKNDTTLAYRQITILPADGPGFAHSGSQTLGTYAHLVGENCVVAGNMLYSKKVIHTMYETFCSETGSLEIRLLNALKSGMMAGGEEGPVHSAGISVSRNSGWSETDLRVDWSDSPIKDIEKLLEMWLPQRDDYIVRGINPQTAPSYGVPGNE